MEKDYITITGMEHYFGNKIFKNDISTHLFS